VIRKIPVHRLVPGMYVADLHRGWLEHTLWRSRFLVRDEAMVNRLIEEGITEVSIDTERGVDIPRPPSAEPRLVVAAPTIVSRIERLKAKPQTLSLGEERRRAGLLLREANATLKELMTDARLGRIVDIGKLEPFAERMIESVMRNPDALAPLARLKLQGSYATEHALATTSLVVALARQQGLELAEIERLAMGTLVKDVGHAALDARLVAKPGQLSMDERAVMESHVEEGLAVLEATSRLAETSVAVILEHHERFDGSGYPFHMSGSDISNAGRMVAIVDTYDAMTSDRPYRRAVSPTIALGQIFDEGGHQFDAEVVAGFIRAIGVYPVGTLVRLESGHLAVVEELHPESLLSPQVRVIFHAGRRSYVTPVVVDLSATYGNHYGQIVGSENFEDWGLSPVRWQPA